MTSTLPTLPGPSAAACGPPSTGLDPGLDAGRLALIAKALSEPVRVSLLDVLRRHGRPVCQCELVPLFDLPQSTLSHHVSKLVAAGLVDVERRHRWAFYSASPAALEPLGAWVGSATPAPAPDR
jgi:ArsR family transcriptional regulator, arsenate/arsenite/antimonite-responsive transcriptional repressor